jgi:hypothetical protein
MVFSTIDATRDEAIADAVHLRAREAVIVSGS